MEATPRTFRSEKARQAYKRKLERQAEAKLDVDGLRTCKKCNTVKPHSHMKRDAKRPYGIQRICKDCDNKVWPKHQKRLKAALQGYQFNAAHTVAADMSSAISAYFDQEQGKPPAGLIAHPDSELYNPKPVVPPLPPPVYPADEPNESETKQVGWWDNFFAQQRAKPMKEADLPAGLLPLSKVPEPKRTTVNPMAEGEVKRVVRNALESSEQKALRAKMEQDGFSQRMTDGAVKLLPTILRELKAMDQT